MLTIEIDHSLCTKCGICAIACNAKTYTLAGDDPVRIDVLRCWGCGHCVAACPEAAIQHGSFPLDRCTVIDKAKLPNLDGLTLAFQKRRSVRAFKPKAIPRESIEQLLTISTSAPTGHNLQEVDWAVIDSPDLLARLCKDTVMVLYRTAKLLENPLVRLYLGLTEGFDMVSSGKVFAKVLADLQSQYQSGQDPIFYHAPAVLVAHVPIGTYFGRDDAIHALYNVELAAERVGLGSCQMGYFKIAMDRDRRMKSAIGLPADRSPEATLAIGYPAVDHLRVIPRRRPSIQWY